MAKLVATWRKVDVTRALLAAKAGGLNVGRVEIENGRIILVSGETAAAPADELTKWELSRARKA